VDFEDSLDAIMEEFAESRDIDIPEELPLMAVRDVVVFNSMILPLFVGRSRSTEAVNRAMEGNKLIILVTQLDAAQDDPDPEELYRVGMVCMILRTLKMPDGRSRSWSRPCPGLGYVSFCAVIPATSWTQS